MLPEFGSVAPEHPSPVSVLDDTMYRDDALSLVKQMPDVLKARIWSITLGSSGKRQSYPSTISTRPVLQRYNLLEKICADHGAYEEFVSRSSSINAEYEAKAYDTQAAIKDSLMLDQETKEEIDSMSILCLNQLKCVDQHTSTTPKLKIIVVPSLASIEEMRTPAVGDLMVNFTRPNLGYTESKIQQHQQGLCLGASPNNRTPFADVNFS
ncbi:unnamed protein product [Camellia sinensis]